MTPRSKDNRTNTTPSARRRRDIPPIAALMLGVAWLLLSAGGVRAGDEGPVTRARALLEVGKAQEARDLLSAELADRDDPEIQRLLGEAHYQLRDWPAAREHLREALRLDPIAEDHIRLGEVYMREERFALSLEQFRSAWRLGVMDGELHYRLAVAYAGLERYFGDVRKVATNGKRVGDRVNDVVLVQAVPGDASEAWGASDDSVVYQVHRALEYGQDSLALRLLEARAWLKGRQYAYALALFEKVESRLEAGQLTDAERSQAYMNFAEAAFRADDLGGYLKRVRKAYPDDWQERSQAMATAYRRVAERYADRGELHSCIEFLEQAVAEDPRDPDSYDRLGRRYWEAGNRIKAARAWRILLQLNPDHPDRRELLQKLQTVANRYETDDS